jgi:hypothetical protein
MSNSTILNKSSDRQYPMVAVLEIGRTALANSSPGINSNASVSSRAAFDVPAGAIITGGRLTVDTAWDTTGTATISLGDGGSGTRFLSTVSLKTATTTPFSGLGYKYSAADTIDVVTALADSGGTAGAARLILEYVIAGRGNESQG